MLRACSSASPELPGLAPRAPGLRLLIRWMRRPPATLPFSPTLDWRVLAFTVAGHLAAASLLFSLAPAVQFWNPRLAEALKQRPGPAGGSLRFRRTCVALQIGFSLLLIVGAGMFVRTIRNLRNVNAGFATRSPARLRSRAGTGRLSRASVVPIGAVACSIRSRPARRSRRGSHQRPDLVDDNRGGDVLRQRFHIRPTTNTTSSSRG